MTARVLIALFCTGLLTSCAGLRRDDGKSHRHHLRPAGQQSVR